LKKIVFCFILYLKGLIISVDNYINIKTDGVLQSINEPVTNRYYIY